MTEFCLYCVYCEEVAQFVYKGNSMCRRHFEQQSRKPHKIPLDLQLALDKYKKQNPEALSDIFV